MLSHSGFLVREMRLELTRHTTHAPQTCLSTYSSTLAFRAEIIIPTEEKFVNSFFAAAGERPSVKKTDRGETDTKKADHSRRVPPAVVRKTKNKFSNKKWDKIAPKMIDTEEII